MKNIIKNDIIEMNMVAIEVKRILNLHPMLKLLVCITAILLFLDIVLIWLIGIKRFVIIIYKGALSSFFLSDGYHP